MLGINFEGRCNTDLFFYTEVNVDGGGILKTKIKQQLFFNDNEIVTFMLLDFWISEAHGFSFPTEKIKINVK